ncbi:MAG: hypothetical protein WCF96_04290 [Eubacteriales bacterium]
MSTSKFIAIFITIALVLSSFAGCSSAPAASTDNTTGDKTETSTTNGTSNIDMAYLTKVLSKGAAVTNGVSYDMAIAGAGQTTKMSYAMEGGKIKVSGSNQGVESVTIIDGTTMISYDPVNKTGMKFDTKNKPVSTGTTDPTQGAAPGTVPDSNLSDNLDKTSLVFQEKGQFDGEEVLIVSAKNTGDTGNLKLWINERLGMVVKMEATSADGKIVSTELTNIKVGKLPAGTFDVPSDIKFVEIPSFGN